MKPLTIREVIAAKTTDELITTRTLINDELKQRLEV